ncbi:MAG: transporter substrate-binding domain-containing protein [Synergistaceae bacterium]|nr:transporter substrate-binding domain-containing protein [Synergistaceae bacterium]
MKKFLSLILIIAFFVAGAAVAMGEEVYHDYVGFLARLQTTPEEFFNMMKKAWATSGWTIIGGDHSTSQAKFYDSLVLMQMALSAGEIEEMILPDFVAEYIVKNNPDYSICCVSNSGRMSLAFGFLKKNNELAYKWNAALLSMRNDFTMSNLIQKYIKAPLEKNDPSYEYIYGGKKLKEKNPYEVKFQEFKGAPVIRVAVTGDLPPIDFFTPDGMPAGYSTAILAEIGKRLKLNIRLVPVTTVARTAALVSNRVDVVFWYEVGKNFDYQYDAPKDVILSEPYYSWDTFLHIRFKDGD